MYKIGQFVLSSWKKFGKMLAIQFKFYFYICIDT